MSPGDVWRDVEIVPFRLAVTGAIEKLAAGR